MAIFKHPDGTFKRYPPPAGNPVSVKKPGDEYSNDAHWRQVPGSPPGIQIHRDGKTMRNIAPTPPT